MDQSAKETNQPARVGGEFFTSPTQATQRRYEALRAYFVQGLTATQVAERFGYSLAAVNSAVRDFRAGRQQFFTPAKPGPRRAPTKDAARDRVLILRASGHSIDEIATALAAEGTPLNRTSVAEILTQAGVPRIWRRPEQLRGAPRREQLPRAETINFANLPPVSDTRLAGLLLAVPDLVELDLPGLVRSAGYPGTKAIPAVSSILSLLTLKLTTTRRVSHVDDLAADPGSALFAGLAALPKKSALTSYSYRLDHAQQRAFLAALDKQMIGAGLAGNDQAIFDLDFHAVMHWGHDPALEKHYVPRRSQRTRAVLTFFAQDSGTHNLVYANADLSKHTQNREPIAFCDHWRQTTGADPAMLVMDQKVTTQAVLGELDQRRVQFLTLRMRSPALTRQINALPKSAWKTITLDRPGKHNRPRVAEQTGVTLSTYPGTVRQFIVTGLGHEAPTVIITNAHHTPTKTLIERYAHRMTIEQRLAEAIRSFHLDALSGAVNLNIDLDVVLSVLAHALCAALRRRLPGYETATPDTLQRRFLHTSGRILNRGDHLVVQLNRRTYSPVLRAADLPQTIPVPWWGNRTLRFEYT
jgi:transposase